MEIPVLRTEPREFQSFQQKFSSGYTISKPEQAELANSNSAESLNYDSISQEDINGTNRKRKRKNMN